MVSGNCEKCKSNWGFEQQDEEFICQNCGSAYYLEYLGCYETPSSDERTDKGFESIEWKTEFGIK